jgi:ABC-type nitrate/sulfonate/bicarbonate transport system ATPase subunit
VSGEREGTNGFLVLDRLTKRFGAHLAVDELSLAVPRGDILGLLGPSGSGKTTTLGLPAGFETPDAGRIRVDGEDVTDAAPAAGRFGMVFPHYALFPHLDAGAKVAVGLEEQRVPGAERARRTADALAKVELAGLERRPVGALSGGQQQRVALARAIAPEPRVLLLDEPPSNPDPALRDRTRRELRTLIRRTLPLLRPALAAGASLAFVAAFGDLVTSIMLYTYDTRPISPEILASLRQADVGTAAAYGVVLMSVSAAAFFLADETRGATA